MHRAHTSARENWSKSNESQALKFRQSAKGFTWNIDWTTTAAVVVPHRFNCLVALASAQAFCKAAFYPHQVQYFSAFWTLLHSGELAHTFKQCGRALRLADWWWLAAVRLLKAHLKQPLPCSDTTLQMIRNIPALHSFHW